MINALPIALVVGLGAWVAFSGGESAPTAAPSRPVSPPKASPWAGGCMPKFPYTGQLPAGLSRVITPSGWTLRALTSPQDLATWSTAMQHDLLGYVLKNPVVPTFGFAILDASGRPRGSFVLRWITDGPFLPHWELPLAQGLGNAPVDTETAQTLLWFGDLLFRDCPPRLRASERTA